jgi:CHAD domain-containing protein
MTGVEYLLPDGVRADTALAERLDVAGEPLRALQRTFYDTFDGRLHDEELVLIHEDGRMTLVEAAGYGGRVGAEHARAPARLLAADLPPGPLREALEALVEMRALLPTATVRTRTRRLRVLDDEGKTVVRLAAETASLTADGRARTPLRSRLHVMPVRGYDGELRRVRRTLEEELGLAPAEQSLHDEAVAAAGGRPGGVHTKPDVDIIADERTDAAAAAVLTELLATIEANVPGTLEDIDTEFLHDLRVSVRRTRSVQRQLAGAFPARELERYRAEFKHLQQVTGPTRDLDVNLLEFDHLRSLLAPELAADLDPLRGLLEARREAEFRKMGRALRSARTRRVLDGWAALIAGLVISADDDRPAAARPIAEVAGERIHKVHRRMVKMGRAIDDDSPHEALHELRKKGKELRYLLELFGGVFPPDVIKPMVKTLKTLQNVLGRFQDREVQAALLRSLRDDVAALEGGPAALMAMGQLIDELGRDQDAARAEFAEQFAAFASKEQRRLVRETFA